MKTVIEMASEVFDKMPPDRHCREPYWTATDEELERFAELVRADAIADEREAIYDEWWSCVMSDLENGVKSLNEKAAADWHKNYPAQSKMFPEWIEARSNT